MPRLQSRAQSHAEELVRQGAEAGARFSAERSQMDMAHQKVLSELGLRHEGAVKELGLANERLQAEVRALQAERLRTLEEAGRY